MNMRQAAYLSSDKIHMSLIDSSPNTTLHSTRVDSLIVATIYLQLIQNRYVSKFYCPSL